MSASQEIQTEKLQLGFGTNRKHTLADSRSSLTDAVAQVEELGTADDALLLELNLVDSWRVDWEDTLDTNTTSSNLANSKSLASFTASNSDHDTFENLDAELVAFLDFLVHANRVSNRDIYATNVEVLSHNYFLKSRGLL